MGRGRVVVDEDRERDPLVSGERRGVLAAAGPDGDHLGALRLELLVLVAQLRGVLAAEQSAEVAEEHEDHRAVGPVVPEAVGRAVGVGQRHVREGVEIHAPDRYRGARRRGRIGA